MTFCLIEVRNDAVTWVGAGHEPALLVDPGSGTVTDLQGDGLPLGIDPGIRFHEHYAPFRNSGEVLVSTAGESWPPGWNASVLLRSLMAHMTAWVAARTSPRNSGSPNEVCGF
jgi:sigma-B regulation protein RsbU (phosphoserine phosphatase)